MTKEEFCEEYEVNDGTIILEDWNIFSGGIIGVSTDKNHIVYGYEKLVESFVANGIDEDSARDWLDYNTLGMLPNWPEDHRPIICYTAEL